MALNSSQKDMIARRRERVAELRARRRTQREIVTKLSEEGIVNPDTGKPFSIGTINADLQQLTEDWRRRAEQDITDMIGEMLAENREVRREAWVRETPNLSIIIQSISEELRIVGFREDRRREAGATLRDHGDPPDLSLFGLTGQTLSRELSEALTRATADQQQELLRKYEEYTTLIRSLLAAPGYDSTDLQSSQPDHLTLNPEHRGIDSGAASAQRPNGERI